jgi:hypothetical protein
LNIMEIGSQVYVADRQRNYTKDENEPNETKK